MIDREDLKSLCHQHTTHSNKRQSYRQKLIYVFILLFSGGLLMMPSCFHHKKEIATKNITVNQNHYQYALSENLSKLKSLKKSMLRLNNKREATTPNVIRKTKESKIHQLRQHAPTRLFDLDGKESISKNTNHLKHDTLLDKTPYSYFANQTTHASHAIAKKLTHPKFTIPQGEFMHAILETAINSDLPGMIRAVLTHPIYSYLGHHLLIPAGSRLIGQYSSKTLQGINRIMVIWQRILLPNGISITIDSPGSDSLGRSGLSANDVNTHFLQRFTQASLLSLISRAVSDRNVDNSSDESIINHYQAMLTQPLQHSANQSLNYSIHSKPTLTVYQGSKIVIFVAKDLDFYEAMNVDSTKESDE